LSPELRFEVLGPLRAWRGNDELDLGAPQQRAVLAALVLASGQQVPLDALVDAVWEKPPRAASSVVRTYVSRLRQCLGGGRFGGGPVGGPGRPGGGPGTGHEVIASAGDGYILRLGAEAVDVDVYARLTGEARTARSGGGLRGLRAAECLLHEAAALWRGEPLAGVPGPHAEAKRVWLTELRITTDEDRLAVDIDLGDHPSAIPELQELAVRHPLRERLRELLMLALYRVGRQADALGVFDETRHLLSDQLGIDPGAGLREMHQRILRMDKCLDASPARPPEGVLAQSVAQPVVPSPVLQSAVAQPLVRPAVGPVVGPVTQLVRPLVRPAQLPADVAAFAGRGRELAQLYAALGQTEDPLTPVVLVTIDGMPGVGKTALAVHWAHLVADQFPDGVLYRDLHGFDPSGHATSADDALLGFVQALGVSASDVPADHEARAALYRSLLNGRRMLILLDNAYDVAQVQPLLPGSHGSMVIVTSRARMTGLIATRGARPLPLTPLDVGDARDALSRRLSPRRVGAEPQALNELARLCAGLPLAVSIVAARATEAPHVALAAFVDELRDPGTCLAALSTGDSVADVRLAFSASYEILSLPARRLLVLLAAALASPRFSATAAASVAGMPAAKAQPLLHELTAARMLVAESPGWYSFHELIRLYAFELTGAGEPGRQAGPRAAGE
jgi:DNA-binding SARP family transcriptional activator